MKYVIMAILIAVLTGCNCSTPATTVTIEDLGISTVKMLKGEKKQAYFEAHKVLTFVAEVDAYEGPMADLIQAVMQREVNAERMEYNVPKLNATYQMAHALLLRLDRQVDLDLLEWEVQIKILKEYLEAMAAETMGLPVEEIDKIKNN